MRSSVECEDVSIGLWKALIFAVLIAWSATFRGFQTTGGARGVGRATSRTAVESAVLILCGDYGSDREGDDVVVRSTLVTSSRERVPIDYRMHMTSNRWVVVDLSIEGVSLVNHFRKTFAQALGNMTVPELIDRLKRQLPPPAH